MFIQSGSEKGPSSQILQIQKSDFLNQLMVSFIISTVRITMNYTQITLAKQSEFQIRLYDFQTVARWAS